MKKMFVVLFLFVFSNVYADFPPIRIQKSFHVTIIGAYHVNTNVNANKVQLTFPEKHFSAVSVNGKVIGIGNSTEKIVFIVNKKNKKIVYSVFAF